MQNRILEHLKKFGSITAWEAIRDYGCTRLSHYIWLLRNENYNIEDEWICVVNRYGEKVKFKNYILGGGN